MSKQDVCWHIIPRFLPLVCMYSQEEDALGFLIEMEKKSNLSQCKIKILTEMVEEGSMRNEDDDKGLVAEVYDLRMDSWRFMNLSGDWGVVGTYNVRGSTLQHATELLNFVFVYYLDCTIRITDCKSPGALFISSLGSYCKLFCFSQ
ncbi:hypothetical protein Droror1_Dr00003913 [Drosera rotundifolia]